MRKSLIAAAALLSAVAALAHVTPNVELVRKGDFLKQSLPGATRFFERQLMISGPDGAAIRKTTGWAPSEEDVKVYVGRDEKGGLIGSVVFLWMPSEHGPVGVGVAFDSQGVILRAAVTDVGSEPLAWVRPLVSRGGMEVFARLPADAALDPSRVAPEVRGAMSRYYAKVIVEGVRRARALERLAMPTGNP
ncbi:MAG TPA: hypothetical protein VLO07_07720 [Thermoanaerobaculia bacterium]|nr:hypothetical protein [Thermoanaerobaculia bacterium]